jgi:glycosyltransferase involved in cell wall biosynthesis
MRADLFMNVRDMMISPFLVVAGALHLAFQLRKERFDLIQAHWAVPNSLIAMGGRFLARSKAKIFTSFPGSDVTILTRLGPFGKLLARIIGRSDQLSCNSADLKEDLVKAGLDGRKIDLVIYGVDDGRVFYSEGERSRLRASWNISDDDVVLLMIGRFVPKKGFSTAFRALKHIARRGKNVRLVVVGDGPLRSEYDSILRKDGTAAAVTFVGEIPTQDLGSYYSACDIFLMPSRRLPSDGLNVVVPEAMACGRPVIASSAGGNDLVVFPGINGLLHRENDPQQLAEQVLALMERPDLRAEMGRKGLHLVHERFNGDAIARYYLTRYEDLVRV